MKREEIVKLLDGEIAGLMLARKLLGGDQRAPKKPARREISPEGRKNIGAAQRKRWALIKRSA